jgi:DNA-binding NarL/FixJ family response regulator
MTSLAPIRVYVVDDHPIMRSGVAQLISNESDMVVVGEAADAQTAFSGILESKPDIVIVDISLPGKNGLELIKDIRCAEKSVAMLVHSMHDESLYVERALRAGAQGYLDKQEGGEKLIEAIHTILGGEVYVSGQMSTKILDIFSNRKSPSSDPVEGLSDRQFEVFQMIGRGKGTRAVAAELGVSVKTVDAHRANIKEKLRLGSGNELVRYAVRWVESQEK